VGQNGSAQGILGGLNLDPNGPSWSAVMVGDSADPTPHAVTITQTSITGLSPAAITYAGVSNLMVAGGSGGNKFTFPQGPPNLPGGMTIQGGSGINTLNGPDSANTWQITGANAGALDGVVTFTSIQNLIGGNDNDTFAFNTGGKLAGTLDGGGTNTLDYSAYVGDITVNMQQGAATGVAGDISNIGNVTGSQGNDLIVGDANANVLVGGTGRNIIIGGGGSDTITGGGGDNILIGGRTVWDTNPTELAAIVQEWTDTSLTFNQRVYALRKGIVVNGHTYALNRSTVMADSAPDTLNGGSGRNWIFIDSDDAINNGAGPGANDRVANV
jgi:Ca2+-binding RTX toxin-like protein